MKDLEELIKQRGRESARAQEDFCTSSAGSILNVVDSLVNVLRSGGKVLVAGNGGSAADAQHFAAELVSRFLMERHPLACVALTTDTSVITSISNDQAVYSGIFNLARQKYESLQQFCASRGFEHYTAPTIVRKAGFLIKRSTQDLQTITPVTSPEPLPQCRIIKKDDAIYLQHYTNSQWTDTGTSWPV